MIYLICRWSVDDLYDLWISVRVPWTTTFARKNLVHKSVKCWTMVFHGLAWLCWKLNLLCSFRPVYTANLHIYIRVYKPTHIYNLHTYIRVCKVASKLMNRALLGRTRGGNQDKEKLAKENYQKRNFAQKQTQRSTIAKTKGKKKMVVLTL